MYANIRISITLGITAQTHIRGARAVTVAMRAPLAPAACAALLLLWPASLVLCYQDERGYQAEDAYQDDVIDA